MRRGVRLAAFMLAIGLCAALSGTAQAASIWEKNFWMSGPRYEAAMPLCDDAWPLERISGRFSSKESRYWNSDLQIVEFLHVREIAFRPWAVDTIPRRFCSGTVVVSDGKRRRINFSIIEDGGIGGAKWGVEWCVVGLDRNWAYNPACRMAQP
jgi:hypothetical protein